MVQRNPNFAKLQAGYLFPEINRRKKILLEKHPDAKLISLGIGNTTEPLTPTITNGLVQAAQGLGTLTGYSGYGDEQGLVALRRLIAEKLYKQQIAAEEITISDGSKCDIGRLQVLFGKNVTVAVQDPSYPVYVDGSVILGATGEYNQPQGQFDNIVYMPCTPENNFFPDLSKTPRTDLIYFCSPNNPTGAVATKAQLTELVAFAKKNRSIIIFDAAYSEYINEPHLPKTIFEIAGAQEVALEVNSFSKSIGFTGVRLGWCVIPQALKFEDGTPVLKDWNRVVTTLFNGASNITQPGGIAALSPEGLAEMHNTVQYYMQNASVIREALTKMHIKPYGGTNAPYIWAHFPGKKSWEIFEKILYEVHVVTTPGVGFGPAGESFIRFSSFGHHADIQEAVQRLQKLTL